MKSLKEYSLNIPEQDYHNLPAWSYSIIAKYARGGFPSLTTLHTKTEPTSEMRFGSLFDRLLTGGPDAKNDFTVCDISVPDAEKKMLDCIALITECKPYHLLQDEEFKRAQELSGYQSRWGINAVKNHLDPYATYYEALSSGKEIVSREDWNDVNEMVNKFREDSYLKDLFGTENSENIEYLYQLQFLVPMCINEETGETADIKIMPDLLKINHAETTIRPVDLKTSSMPAYQFADHFVKMRYDIQASEYTDVLQEIINHIPAYKNYTILPYLFTDISRTDKVPVTFEYDPRSESQINGLTIGTEKQYTYKNWKQLLSEIINYENSNAVVPSHINTEGANDLIDLLNYSK